MKNKYAITSLVLGAMLAFSGCSSSSDIMDSDVPPSVKAAFQAKYPGAEDVEWELEKEDGRMVYEAEFKHEGKNKEALFGADGAFLKED